MRLSRSCLALLVVAAAPGCSAISALGEASRPLEIYELQVPEAGLAAARRRNIEVIVEEPAATGALATERIMVQPAPLRAQYLPDVRWSDPAPAMLQTLLLRSLAQSGGFASVGRRPVGAEADFAVLTELTDFQAEIAGETPGATIRVRALVRLVRERDARVIASEIFEVTETAAEADADTLVAAFDRATSRLLAGIVSWLVSGTSAGA